MTKSYIKNIINQWNNTGRVAFLYPRLKKIALNGGKLLDIDIAIKHMLEVLNK